MDSSPEEMGFAGVAGICSEAVKLLSLYTRHFLTMAGTLVLPLGMFLFSHGLASDPLMNKLAEIGRSEQRMDAEFVGLYAVAVLYLVFVLALSQFATAAIVYSVACIYTVKGVSFRKVMQVVPKVWSRLMNTFLWAHILVSFYFAAFMALLLALLVVQETTGVSMALLVILSGVVFNVFLVHFNLVWSLASVVSVLEDTKGASAMKRSNALIAGKRLTGFYLLLIYAACVVGMLALFRALENQGTAGRVVLSAILLMSWTTVTLVAIVVQSIFYFVCKSYHQEIIDRSALAEKLDGYLGDYVPLSRDPAAAGALDAELEEV